MNASTRCRVPLINQACTPSQAAKATGPWSSWRCSPISAIAALRPIIVIKEATGGLGMQLRLVAGPLNDAGAAARICAVLTENKRPCETTIFDGQRLSLKPDDPPSTTAKPPLRRRGIAKRAATAVVVEEAPKKPEPPPAATQATTTQTSLSTFFSRKSSQ